MMKRTVDAPLVPILLGLAGVFELVAGMAGHTWITVPLALVFLKAGKETRSFKDVMNCLFCALRAHDRTVM